MRLSKSEVEAFAKEGCVEERTEFINGTLIYSVKTTNAETLSADYVNENLTVFIPVILLMQLASTNQVSLNYNMPVNDGRYLFILLEKDFKCIDAEVSEDQSDYFQNPYKTCF